MNNNAFRSLRIVDLLGGSVVLGTLFLAGWFMFVLNEQAGAELSDLSRRVQRGAADINALRAALQAKRDEAEDLQIRLSNGGQLPAEAPVEEYFGILSRLAREHGLSVVRNQPLAPRRYPGRFIEQRFTFEITGTTADLLRFLRAVEELSDYWADVGFLKLDRGVGPEAAAAHRRVATLTLSLFSAPPAEMKDHAAPSEDT